jgi:haloacetate dehalogenase
MEHATADVDGLRVHYVHAGVGPLLVLLHGWPQTSHCWRHVMAPLAERFTVVAPDLRGYGLTDKPPHGYDKRTMAQDIRALARHLGFEKLHLVGHDRGARVAHRYGLDRPEEVLSLTVLDIAPTRAMFHQPSPATARGFWHWLFHLQPDLPELLVGPRVETYLRWFFERWTVNRPAVEEAVPEYVAAFSRPGALRAGFDDYRATYPDDLELDEADAQAGRRLPMPVLALWGSNGLPAALPVLELWGEYAKDVTGGPIAGCGHFVPEEVPEYLVERLLPFLDAAERASQTATTIKESR